MRLIAITMEHFFDSEADVIDRLFDSGLETLHLRKPASTSEETAELIEKIDPQNYPKIVLHDHYELAGKYGLKGIHLNSRNIRENHRCTASCHTLAEVAAALSYCDYVFLSPIFDSISKAGYKQGFDMETLRKAASENIINERVIALGGIRPDNISLVHSIGFGGVAVIGSLWGDYAQDNDLEKLLERFYKLKKWTDCYS